MADKMISVKVTAGAKSCSFEEISPDYYKVRINAVREKGKANKALIYFLSQKLKISKNRITIISGLKIPLKRIKITDFEKKN